MLKKTSTLLIALVFVLGWGLNAAIAQDLSYDAVTDEAGAYSDTLDLGYRYYGYEDNAYAPMELEEDSAADIDQTGLV